MIGTTAAPIEMGRCAEDFCCLDPRPVAICEVSINVSWYGVGSICTVALRNYHCDGGIVTMTCNDGYALGYDIIGEVLG